MRRPLLLVLTLAAGGAGPMCGARAEPVSAGAGDLQGALKKHVEFLAGPDLKGRGTWDDRKKAADYVATGFEKAGLKPLPGRTTYFVDDGGTAEKPQVRNVCGWWPEPPKEAKDAGEYVILSAHYDHLGEKDGKVYPGADDNASGVAVLLEAARQFTEREKHVQRIKPLRRALCLVAFDLEEQHLLGSKAFVARPPVPLEKCSLFVTMDQMGRSLSDLEPGLLFLMGSEHCEWLDRTVHQTTVAEGVTKEILGIDFQPPTGYSDYVPFQEKQRPFLFISTGAAADYHQPGDTPEKLDYAHMAVHTEFVRDLLTLMLDAEDPIAWRPAAPHPLEEVEAVHHLLTLAAPRIEDPDVPAMIRGAFGAVKRTTERLIAKGEITPQEREQVRGMATLLFVQAQNLPQKVREGPR